MSGHKTGLVSVETTARVHLGFMDPSGRGSRAFGSVGISLDQPCTHLLIGRSDGGDDADNGLVVTGPEQNRVRKYVLQLADYFGNDANVQVMVKDAIPAHAGLGSGTQLALATGTAYCELMGIDTSPREIAMVLGRGKRSGVGIGAFQTGGILFDAGPNKKGGIAPILSRIPFPSKWRVLLAIDKKQSAIHGDREIKAFETLGDFPQTDIAELCRRTVMELLPAAAEEDFPLFCSSVGAIQDAMGQYFAPVQGGHYTSAQVGEVIRWFKEQGFSGVGQSSWGPTGLVLVESEKIGEELVLAAKRKWPSETGLEFILASGLNHGARVERLETFPGDIDGEVGQPA